MKHILYTLAIIYAAWLSFPFLTAARERGISLSLTEASVGDDDSVTIRLHIVLTDIRVPTSRSLIFEPCITNDEHTLALPAVVVSGRRRARYDARALAVDPATVIPRQQLLLPSRSPQKEQQP